MLRQIGEWSNPEQLAKALNESQPQINWIGSYFDSGVDALKVANKGEFGAVLQAPRVPAHMVTISPVPNSPGMFLVQDTGVGATYNVKSAWIEQYVAGGVWKK